MTLLLAADIGPDTIPGTVAIPTWCMVAAILFLYGKSEWDRAQQAKRREAEIATMNASAVALDKMAENVAALSVAVGACRVRSS